LKEQAGDESVTASPMSAAAAASVVVMDKHDNYVALVSSLNSWFGSKVDHLN
jgi:gamma-glutamyltranspeptidase